MKKDISIHQKENQLTYAKAVKDVCDSFDDARLQAFTSQVAENRLLGEILSDAREIVEKEAILLVEALDLALSEKSQKLKSLNFLIEQVSGQSAFMKSALGSIQTKSNEIELLNNRLSEFVSLVEKVSQMAEDGRLNRVAKAISAINSK